MVFSKSNKFVIPRIHIGNHLVELTDYFRFSWVLIDTRMIWIKNINYVFNKLRIVYFLMYKASIMLDDKSLRLKLRNIVKYKSYLFALNAFNVCLQHVWLLFSLLNSHYGMRYINNFVWTICKSNIRSVNVLFIALKI